MKRFLIVFVSVLLFFNTAFAANIEGTYSVTGWNPGANPDSPPAYTGKLAIIKKNETYELGWTIGTSVYGGIGIHDETTQTLSVSYADLQQGTFGIVIYQIKGNTLEGRWTAYKSEQLGKEIAQKSP